MTFRPDPKPEKKKKVKATGEKELFIEIWFEREHICDNCKKGMREPEISNFHHIKHKSKYPELRLAKDNIVIWCFDCHYIHHNGTKEQFNNRTKNKSNENTNL